MLAISRTWAKARSWHAECLLAIDVGDPKLDSIAARHRSGTGHAVAAALSVLLTLVLVSKGRAQDSARGASDRWEKPFTLALNLGLGTPTGFVGAEAQYNPSRYLGFAAGVGVNRVGPQLMAALRPRLPLSETVALSLSVGWSMGPYKQVDDASFYIDGPYPPVFDRHWAPAHWINVDAGLEVMSGATWIRVYFGIARLLNVNDFTCTGDSLSVCETGVWSEEPTDYSPSESYPFIGVQIGFMP